MTIAEYSWSNATTEPPTGSQIRFNAAIPADVTRMWISTDTATGVDIYRALVGVPIDTRAYVQDKDDHLSFLKFRLAAAPIDRTEYVEWPVVYEASGGSALTNNQAIVFVVTTPADTTPPEPEPPLHLQFVSLADAKFHLNSWDPADDPQVTKYLERASGAIWDYLNKAATDTPWDAINAPAVVQAATLDLLGHLWEHRGDDLAPDVHDANVWDAITRLLMRSKDPTLA